MRAVLRVLKASGAMTAYLSGSISNIDLHEIEEADRSHRYHKRRSKHLLLQFRNFVRRRDFGSVVCTVIENGWVSEGFLDLVFDVYAELEKCYVIKRPTNDIELAYRKRSLRFLRSMGIKVETDWE